MSCIFVKPPKHCSLCLDTRKLQCLLDHEDLDVTEEGRLALLKIIDQECRRRSCRPVKPAWSI